MLKSKRVLWLLVITISFSSCGIFKKNCNCPHFGATKATDVQMLGVQISDVRMIG